MKKAILAFTAGVTLLSSVTRAQDSNQINNADLISMEKIYRVGEQIADRKLVPEYEYIPSEWETKWVNIPSKEVSTTTSSTGSSSRRGFFSSSSSSSSSSSTTTHKTGDYWKEQRVMIAPSHYKKISSVLTELPFTISDIELVIGQVQNMDRVEDKEKQGDARQNLEAYKNLVGATQTRIKLKTIIAQTIDNEAINKHLSDSEIALLGAVEKFYLSGEGSKLVELDSKGPSDEDEKKEIFVTAPSEFLRTRADFIASLISYAALHNDEISNLRDQVAKEKTGLDAINASYDSQCAKLQTLARKFTGTKEQIIEIGKLGGYIEKYEPRVDADSVCYKLRQAYQRQVDNSYEKSKNKVIHNLAGLLAHASKLDKNSTYWAKVDALNDEVNKDRELVASSNDLITQIQSERLRSMGALMRRIERRNGSNSIVTTQSSNISGAAN